MKTRIITAIVACALLLPVLLFSDSPLLPIMLSLCSVVAIYEIASCIGVKKDYWLTVPLYLFAAGLPFFVRYAADEELVTKVFLETGGSADEGGRTTPLEIEAPDMIAEITTEVCIQQSMKVLSEKEQSILRLRLQGKNMSEIAVALGYHDASGVKKAIKRIGQKLIDAGVVDPELLTGRKIAK